MLTNVDQFLRDVRLLDPFDVTNDDIKLLSPCVGYAHARARAHTHTHTHNMCGRARARACVTTSSCSSPCAGSLHVARRLRCAPHGPASSGPPSKVVPVPARRYLEDASFHPIPLRRYSRLASRTAAAPGQRIYKKNL